MLPCPAFPGRVDLVLLTLRSVRIRTSTTPFSECWLFERRVQGFGLPHLHPRVAGRVHEQQGPCWRERRC